MSAGFIEVRVQFALGHPAPLVVVCLFADGNIITYQGFMARNDECGRDLRAPILGADLYISHLAVLAFHGTLLAHRPTLDIRRFQNQMVQVA